MRLKAVLESLDDLDTAYHALYTQKDGKFLLNVDDVDSFPRVVSLKDENAKFRIKAREAENKAKEKYAFLEDLDLEEVKTKLDKYDELEAAATTKGGKLDDVAINKIVETRLAAATAPLKRELDKAKKDLGERDTLIVGFTEKERTRSIHDSVREAVGKIQGFQPAAVDDALVFAERMLHVNEDGKVVTKDSVGVTPGVEASVWLSDMQAKKPHWWGPTTGGGSTGNNKGGGGGSNPWSKDGWNMTAQGAMIRENRGRAEQMAKAAGSSIGATRPTETK